MQLGVRGFGGRALVRGAVLFAAWAVIMFRCVRAVHKREIVWPGHDEDT